MRQGSARNVQTARRVCLSKLTPDGTEIPFLHKDDFLQAHRGFQFQAEDITSVVFND